MPVTDTAPAADSPLRNAGDPADGPGSYIGAVGVGDASPRDFFGRPAVNPVGKTAR